MAIILLAFFLNQKHIIRDDSLAYDLLNLLGGILLVVYAWSLHSYPFLALNIIWSLISLKDMVSDVKQNKTRKFL